MNWEEYVNKDQNKEIKRDWEVSIEISSKHCPYADMIDLGYQDYVRICKHFLRRNDKTLYLPCIERECPCIKYDIEGIKFQERLNSNRDI